ncbi:MAG: molybdopterin-binding/glycosyltransferase family 2 protein [Devosia sp.]
MTFGTVPTGEAQGAILAHSQRTETKVIRKGTVLSQADIAALMDAGIDSLTVARLGPDDVHEDEAARILAEAVAGEGIVVERAATGRANLFARESGLTVINKDGVDALNAVDPAITLATLERYQRVDAGRMVGTVKIIPFAASRQSVEAAVRHARGLLSIAPWRMSRVAAVSTLLPALKASVVDKTVSILSRRLSDPGASIHADMRVDHTVPALREALVQAASEAEVVVVFGASAVVDGDDVIPAAIRAAGGTVRQVGMPVDPGNLLVLGTLDGKPVVGAPGCARSPKPNGFDFVLDRLLAHVPITPSDISGMGVGGLLMETAMRPQPREGTATKGAVKRPAAIILAAGRSTRMGAANKLIEEVDGKAMVRRVCEAALLSRADPVVVVTGHAPEAVAGALAGLDVRLCHNADYADGLSTSLRAGLNALPGDADAALLMLGDMPLITADHCNSVLDGLAREGALIATATAGGKRGNPVAWSRRLFDELRATEGDAGGRALMSRYADALTEVEIGTAASLDADTPAALQTVREAAKRTDFA